jgi:hypothetical protein
MATTSPDNIEYPVNSDQVAPLASHFKNLADSTQEALNTKPDTLDLPDVIEKLNNLEYAQFDTTYAGGSTQPGMLAWDADNETLQFQLDSNVTLQVGQEHVIRVKNASGSVAIPNGTVVMFAGAAGDTVTVSPAVSDGSISINYLVGITTEQIPADGFGFVTQLGFVNGVNTNAYNVGDILYPNPAVPGGLTATEPESPNWKIPIAAVTKKNASSGRLLVRAIGGGGGGGASVTVEETAPSVAAPGDLWLDSTDGTLYVYYEDVDGNQWIQVQANSALGASIEARLGALESQAIAYGNQNPNVIINGGFDIWQRGTSFTANGFTADRWRIDRPTGATVSQETSDVPTGFRFALKQLSTASNSYTQFGQQIEFLNCVNLQNRTVTISFWMKALASTSGSTNVTVRTRTSATVDAAILFSGANVDTTVVTSTSWARYSVTRTFTTFGALSLEFALPANVTNDGFLLTGVQVEAGQTATTFRRNANSIQGELAACQRYYWRSVSGSNSSVHGFGLSLNNSLAMVPVVFPVTMRTVPSSVEWSQLQVSDWFNYSLTVSSLSIDVISINVGTVIANHPAGSTATRAAFLRNNNTTAGFIAFSSEL